jgi:hypothetical protein
VLRYSTQTLLLAVTELAIGLGALAVVKDSRLFDYGWSGVGLLVTGCALIGTALFGLANRPWLGATLGAFVGFAVLVTMFLYTMSLL